MTIDTCLLFGHPLLLFLTFLLPGSFGAVYAAMYNNTPVAVKVHQSNMLSTDDFLNEANLALYVPWHLHLSLTSTKSLFLGLSSHILMCSWHSVLLSSMKTRLVSWWSTAQVAVYGHSCKAILLSRSNKWSTCLSRLQVVSNIFTHTASFIAMLLQEMFS